VRGLAGRQLGAISSGDDSGAKIRFGMAELPGGTVTFLFTDVECSTELVKRLQEHYAEVLAAHYDLLSGVFAEHGGVEMGTQGDALFVVFRRARDAVEAAVAAQRALGEYRWPDEARISVRMGLHTGEPYVDDDGYTGVAVHRAARICTVAHGGQVLLSGATAGIVDDHAIAGVDVRDLGEYQLKDIDRAERVFQLVADGLSSEFPPLRTMDQQVPLAGTVTIVMAEGRRMMGLSRVLSPEHFGALLSDYQRLLVDLFVQSGGSEVEAAFDSALAAFPTAKQAALAAVAAQRVVAAHEWPNSLKPAISVALHSGPAGIGWVGPAALRCAELCDTAEGGQILMSHATASLLEDEDLGALLIRRLGPQQTRRTGETVHPYELVVSYSR
jgi:class 3 adenylate cyclase